MKLHASWFIGWGCLGFLVGVGLCAFTSSDWFSKPICLAVAVLLATSSVWFRFRWLVLVMCIAGCLAGVWRGSQLQAELSVYQPYYETVVTLQGHVAQDPSTGSTGDLRLNLKHVIIKGENLQGEVWVSVPRSDIKRGDRVTVHGKLGEGFGSLSATMYRAQVIEVIRPNPGDIARRVRDWFAAGVRVGIPDTQASLGLGYLVGQKTALPEQLEQDIKATGLTHVVVASGYNLTILVVFSRRIFLRASKYLATLMSTLMVLAFMLVTGFSPSMSRAGLVAILGLMVWYYGRKMHPFVLLSFAAAVTVWLQPSYLWGDLGWYLSFTSFIGVIVLAPLLHHYYWGIEKKPGLFRELIISTLAAQIVTTPVILLTFNLFAVYALLANLLVLPLVPLAMLCTFIAGLAGLIVPGLAAFLALPAVLILTYSTSVIQYIAGLPNAQIELVFNSLLMIGSYIGLGIVITYLKRRTHHDFRDPDSANDTY
ncbi:MAG: ComEC/Rec2 family competence protein [Candidatus Saccharimonadales bacterium]